MNGRAARLGAALLVAASLTACAAPARASRTRPEPRRASDERSRLEPAPEPKPATPRPVRPTRSLSPEARGVVHVVKKGETAWRIARTYDLTTDELLRANELDDARSLKIGTALLIPGARESRRVPKLGEPFPPAAPSPSPVAPAPTAASASASASVPVPVAASTQAPTARLAWPLQGVLYSRFGPRNGHRHDGIDLSAPDGTPVTAAADGEVIFAGKQSGYGSIVILRHAGGLVTVYAHASALLVREGATVQRGHVIARVGRTGRTSGPHLHFEVRQGTRPRDPLPFLP